MNVPAYSGSATVSFFVLLVLHTLISFGAYRYFAEPTMLLEVREQPSTPVETTTPEQRARGESSFQIRSETRVFSPVPIPVLLYVIAGYAALGLAAAVGLFGCVRQVHS